MHAWCILYINQIKQLFETAIVVSDYQSYLTSKMLPLPAQARRPWTPKISCISQEVRQRAVTAPCGGLEITNEVHGSYLICLRGKPICKSMMFQLQPWCKCSCYLTLMAPNSFGQGTKLDSGLCPTAADACQQQAEGKPCMHMAHAWGKVQLKNIMHAYDMTIKIIIIVPCTYHSWHLQQIYLVMLAILWKCVGQAPYRWLHAHLTPMKDYLKDQVDNGEYEPFLRSGLYDDM